MSEEKPTRVQTIEATSKQWKMAQLVGVALIVVGAASCGLVAGAGGESGIPWVLMLIGLVVWGIGRFGAWWHHG